MKTKTSITFFFVFFFFAAVQAGARAEKLVEYVDPFIGTGGVGFGVGSTYPGPQTPFGMVKPGPDTTTDGNHPGFNHCSGYWYRDRQIRGFSHTRMHGTGVPGYGNIMLMPAYGEPAGMIDEESYRAPLKHKTETAMPGYYAVELSDRGIKVELTAGEYTAHHKYAVEDSGREDLLVVLNASHYIGGGKPLETSLEISPGGREVSGWFHYKSPHGPSKGIKTYFSAVFDREFASFGSWSDEEYSGGRKTADGTTAGAVVGFERPEDGVLEVKLAISFISVEQARENMKTDHPGWDFDSLRARTESAWEGILSRARVSGANRKLRTIFYTAVYHSFQMPTNFTEAGGLYMGFDDSAHRAEGFRYYTDFSMWDTFRSLHPLLVMIAPDYHRDFNISLLKMAEQGGYIPKWPVAAGYTGCMIGTPADVVLADAYLKGITDFNAEEAYTNLRKIATKPAGPGYEGRSGIEDYIKYGYHPADSNSDSTSKTLEFAFNDYALAKFAEALGKEEDAAYFMERSRNYRNLWNPERGFFDGRNADGSFVKDFIDTAWRDVYTEGTAWQWLWFVPQDVPGLIELMGGKETFVSRLDEFFEKSHRAPDTLMYDKWYWHGNEPDIHAAYLYLWAGRPERTQEELRWIMLDKYDETPAGIDGNDDGGTLSAWYVFNAAGFFPIPATDMYLIGSPIFSKTVFDVGGGEFVVEAPGTSPRNMYVQRAELNGEPLKKPYFTHEDLSGGGRLVLDMGPEPSAWFEGI